MGKLNGKVAVITGGAGGIGKETAIKFLQEGANVVLVDLFEEHLNKAKQDLESYGELSTIQADVSKEDDVKKYVKTVIGQFGKIDIFFNNAGINLKPTSITEMEVEDFDKVMAVNIRGVFLGLKHVLTIMMQQNSGSVISTSSVDGLRGAPGGSAYSTSKHAVVGLTKSAALEVAGNNVRVNSIHPSPVNTQMMRTVESAMNADNTEDVKEAFAKAIPLGRYAESSDIVALVLFLASDDSAFITGSQYRIDGGMAAQ